MFKRKEEFLLRAPEPEDLEYMLAIENMPEVWRVSNTTGYYSRYQLREYILKNQNDLYADRQLRLMVESQNGKVAGMVDLFSFEPEHSRAEVGIVITPAFRGQGVGKIALQLLEDHCFRILGLHQLYAYMEVDNEASLKLFAAVGYEKCAYLKDWMRKGNFFSDVVMVQKLNIGIKENVQ